MHGYFVKNGIVTAALYGFFGVPPEGEIFIEGDPATVVVGAAPPKVYVTRLTIIDRLIDAGKLGEAMDLIAADVTVKARWEAATEIATDDPTATALIVQLGLDPAIILAQ